MRSQARRAKPQPKPAKRKGPKRDPTLRNRIPGYVPQETRAHPGKETGDDS